MSLTLHLIQRGRESETLPPPTFSSLHPVFISAAFLVVVVATSSRGWRGRFVRRLPVPLQFMQEHTHKTYSAKNVKNAFQIPLRPDSRSKFFWSSVRPPFGPRAAIIFFAAAAEDERVMSSNYPTGMMRCHRL